MASKAAILLALNLVFFTVVSSSYVPVPCSPPPPPPKEHKGYPHHPNQQSCSIDTLKLGVCADVLGLVKVNIGTPPYLPCCSLIAGLVDLEAAVCLCTSIRANVLGINLNIPVDLSLILNNCGRKVPKGFTCA